MKKLENVSKPRLVMFEAPIDVEQISPAGVAIGTPCKVDGVPCKVGDYIFRLDKRVALIDPGVFKALNTFLVDVEPDAGAKPEPLEFTTDGGE